MSQSTITIIFIVFFVTLALGSAPSHAQEVIPRPEHPRPDRVRDTWLNLNGTWEFAFDNADEGLSKGWQVGTAPLSGQIIVPFPFQAKLSGIGVNDIHHVLWYRRTFALPPVFEGKRVLLHFGAVDYEARVWLNGRELGSHRGGHAPFSFNVTDSLKAGENVLVLRVVDTEDTSQPRGKQYWKEKPEGIWYTRTSGIWQTVWLEAVGQTFIRDFRLTPHIDAHTLTVEVEVDGLAQGWQLRLDARDRKTGQAMQETFAEDMTRAALVLPEPISLWTPEEPNLYDLTLTLVSKESGAALDSVQAYFGMRKISAEGGKLLLNNAPYFQRLVLDQGYWPDGILTAPSDDALRYDVEMAKAFGFNGARKHQKVEDPRWLYWCDTLGFLVWGEMAAQQGPLTPEMEAMFEPEWLAAVRRDYSHPCVVAWTPFNETWGIVGVHTEPRVQKFVERIYNATKAIDPYRPVCDNSGWDHVRTDIADYHDYVEKGEDLVRRFGVMRGGAYRRIHEGRFMFFVDGTSYSGEPIVLSEYGGIGLETRPEEVIGSEAKAWSYGKSEKDIEAYLARFRQITEAAMGIEELSGYCYTQLTDVEQEVNGVMTYDRKPKLEPGRMAEIQLQRK